MNSKVIVVVILAILCFCSFILLSIFAGWFYYYNQNQERINSGKDMNITGPAEGSQITPISKNTGDDLEEDQIKIPNAFPSDLSKPLLSGLPSINNENLTFKSAPRIPNTVIDIIYTALGKTSNWNGNESSELNIQVSDFSDSQINNWIKTYKEKKAFNNIPQSLSEFYLSANSESEIVKEIDLARKEYILFLKLKNIDSKIISDFENIYFPDDQDLIEYVMNATSSGQGTNVEKVSGKKMKFTLYSTGIYYAAKTFDQSGTLGQKRDDKLLRDIGLRFIAYHEFTHILQEVARDNGKNIEKTAMTREYKWGGDSSSDIYNELVYAEASADGIAYEVVTSAYNFSEIQKRLAWEFWFGSTEKTLSEYNAIHDTFERKYPNYNPNDFAAKIFTDLDLNSTNTSSEVRDFFQATLSSLDLSAWGGYYMASKPETVQKIWQSLK